MEHSNCLLSVQPDGNERQPKMDPCAWLVKVLIVRIELQQKDPTFSVRSLPRGHNNITLWRIIRSEFMESRRSNGDRLGPASEIAMLDAFALYNVMREVERNNDLREIFAQAARSIRKAFLHAGKHYEYAESIVCFAITTMLSEMVASRPRSEQEDVDASESNSELAIAHTFLAFLTSVLHLLTSVFQYLIGYVDRGGSKTYSSGAFDFRDTFVALVLFQGAYVWIKFRQAARPDSRKRKAPGVVDIEGCNLQGVYARAVKEKSSGAIARFKYEPRFTPPRQEGDDGIDLRSRRLPLGEYHTPVEAQIVLQIARHYYAKDGGYVELEDGRYKFSIPPMSELERRLTGKEKRIWVERTAKQVGRQMYADFEREKGKHLDMATETVSPEAEFNDPSSSALPLPCSSLPVLPAMVAEPAIASAAPSSPSLSLLSFDGATMGDADDSSDALSDFEDMFAELFCDPGLTNLPGQQSSVVSYQMQYEGFPQMQYEGFPQFSEIPSLPEVEAVAGGIEHVSEPLLNSDSCSFAQGRVLADAGTGSMDGRVFLPQSVPDLQQLVLFQKKRLEDNARQFVDLDHQLKADQVEKSRLQQEKEQLQREKELLRFENESLKSRLQQVARSQVATWTGIMIDIQRTE